MDLAPVRSARRLLIEAELEPVQGKRFQPTGFPDLGPATFQAGDTACLLLESAQSMANRLEETIWDTGSNSLKNNFEGLSYIRVNDTEGAFLTSSTLEAHRLNSVYIEKCEGDFFTKEISSAIGVDKKQPVDRTKFVNALFKYDINSLLHGVFLESLDGRLRIPRSLSAFIEADSVTSVASGGVKNDRVQASKEDGKASKDGFGNVPFHREEFTAETITAYFNVDIQQIRSYGLDDDATELLISLALFKIRALLDGDLRLRTACDLQLKEKQVVAKRPDRFVLPSLDQIADALTLAIKKCVSKMVASTVVYKK
ncbi:type I-U CRISPR-associated protein Cas7 [Rhodopirellula bahusiensis]|uniref:Type I-U CRISPR-associated protein Cas7 n=1 Tax=Rhodopirellula bahusiensis TaxID=2014065 RepID=A0A2G1WBC2_9BACT|nr:type I-U CRISPR-associated protein Cas7 [Rhodopirellula bahusiensis]